MKNKIIIGVIVLIIVIAGGAYFAMSGKKAGAPQTQAPAPAATGTSASSLAALMAAGHPVKCTVTPSADNGNMSGTFYISGGKVRSDYSVTSGGQLFSGHMILMNDTSYTWLDGQATGFKAAAVATNTNVSINSFKETQVMDYHCAGWPADPSKFILPANVKFSDMIAPVPQAPENGSLNVNGSVNAGGTVKAGGATGTAAQCAACDSVPASYKAQCKAALGCK